MEKKKLAIIGLGYVGLPLAVEFGKKMPTTGFDINPQRIKELISGIDNTLEVTSEDIALANQLSFTNKEECLENCNIYIVTVPTPIDSAKRPNLEPLRKASKIISRYLSIGDIVIFESTVYPGCTEEVCVPILENSGLKFNEEFFCGYSPERINPGDKVNTITKIKKITSGSSLESLETIDCLYNEIIEAGTYKAKSIKVAEAAKVIENTQRDINIALINELAIIFEKLNIDTSDVLNAAETKWNFLPFKPGIVGGHCIGIDPYYLTHKSEEVGYNPQVILSGRKVNDSMAKYIANIVVKKMVSTSIDISNARVGIMGITFKENCPDIRNTKVIDIINELNEWNIETIVTDPWANNSEVKDEYGIELQTINDENQVDCLIVAVGHSEYRVLKPKQLKSLCRQKNPIIADIKSIYDENELKDIGLQVYRL